MECNIIKDGTERKAELEEYNKLIEKACESGYLYISDSSLEKLPDSIGELQSLTKLTLSNNKNLEILPDTIGNLKNLVKLYISNSPLEKLPDSIGELQSLTELTLYNNKNLKTLPDSIGNLKNLVKVIINDSSIEELPDSIGGLQSLSELSLDNNKNLKTLPDSIGNLKNLTKLSLRYLPVEKFPDSIVNCTALEYVNIYRTNIHSVPQTIKSIKKFFDNPSIELIPQGHSISYRCFCNSYYRLVEAILQFSKKARSKGLLAMEDDLDCFTEGFFRSGLRLVVDGTDISCIRRILLTELEREKDYYRQKLMEVAMGGILCIQSGYPTRFIALFLATLVKIKDNPLDAACTKYLTGDKDAFSDIDFKAAIQPEEEREEILFIKRALMLNEILHKKGLLALEEHLDHNAIAARDVFEFGLPLIIDGLCIEVIEDILDNLVEHETDPVRKNLALAKKEAVRLIYNGFIVNDDVSSYKKHNPYKSYNSEILFSFISAYFDENIIKDTRLHYILGQDKN